MTGIEDVRVQYLITLSALLAAIGDEKDKLAPDQKLDEAAQYAFTWAKREMDRMLLSATKEWALDGWASSSALTNAALTLQHLRTSLRNGELLQEFRCSHVCTDQAEAQLAEYTSLFTPENDE